MIALVSDNARQQILTGQLGNLTTPRPNPTVWTDTPRATYHCTAGVKITTTLRENKRFVTLSQNIDVLGLDGAQPDGFERPGRGDCWKENLDTRACGH